MKNIKLRLFEYYGLSVELNGNEQTKGLLQENLSLVLKYHLTNLAKKVAEELEVVEKIKLELAQRYGKQNEDGSTTLLTQQEYDDWVEFSRGIWDDTTNIGE